MVGLKHQCRVLRITKLQSIGFSLRTFIENLSVSPIDDAKISRAAFREFPIQLLELVQAVLDGVNIAYVRLLLSSCEKGDPITQW